MILRVTRNLLKKKQESKFYKSLNKFLYFTNSGEDWLSLMVVVRVVVSVTEVLRCLCLRDSVCSAVVVSVGSGSGSDVAVLCWLFCSVVGRSFREAALNRLRKKILRNRIKNRIKGFIYLRANKNLDNRSSPISFTLSGFSMAL